MTFGGRVAAGAASAIVKVSNRIKSLTVGRTIGVKDLGFRYTSGRRQSNTGCSLEALLMLT